MTNCCNYRAHQLLGIGIENEQRNYRSLGNGEAQCRQGQQGLEAHLGSSVVSFEMILNEPLDRIEWAESPLSFFYPRDRRCRGLARPLVLLESGSRPPEWDDSVKMYISMIDESK